MQAETDIDVTDPAQLWGDRAAQAIPHGLNCYPSSQYGVQAIASRYCGLKSNRAAIPGVWQHGWLTPNRPLSIPVCIGHALNPSPQSAIWVASQRIADFLRGEGFLNARAIGLPFCYVETQRFFPRKPGSLLLMPAHSLDYTTHNWDSRAYVAAIESLRSDFTEVVACIHQSCIRHGYWADAFRAAGIPVLAGAHESDPTSLYRLRAIFDSFEFVSTNVIGSHVAYAAACGAKVSVFGPYAETKPTDHANTPFYTANPHLLSEAATNYGTEASMRQAMPQFFVAHPGEAVDQTAWAQAEIGYDCRLAPDEMRRAFGWTLGSRFVKSVKQSCLQCGNRFAPPSIRPTLIAGLTADGRRSLRAWAHAESVAARFGTNGGKTRLFGNALHFTNGVSCGSQLASIIGREIYRFPTAAETPSIIDGGANIGIATLYLLKKYPKARIVAFEPDPTIAELFLRNTAHLKGCDLSLYRTGLSNKDGTTGFVPDGADAGRVDPGRTSTGIEITVQRLKPLLEQTVDFLKLDIEGSEFDVLMDCGEALRNVRYLFVEFHSRLEPPQHLPEFLQLLKDQGFHLHVHSPHPAVQPFMYRPVSHGYDMLLEIFGVQTRPANG